jgi:carboxyl-terminal processing protease
MKPIGSKGWFAAVALAVGVAGPWLHAQSMGSNDAATVTSMLRDANDAVKHNYYDQTFHGVDLDARFKDYSAKIKTAPSLNAGLAMVADFLSGLHDSHTYFAPPPRPYTTDYGYRLIAVGNDIFVSRVRPGTDAAGKVQAGDRVVALNGHPLTRDNLPSAQYSLEVLQPAPTTRLALRNPAGADRQVDVQTKVVPGRQTIDLTGSGASMEIADLVRDQEAHEYLLRQQFVEQGDLMIWKMPIFLANNGEIDRIFSIARRHSTLVLDLRDNPGGLIEAMRRMVSNLFDHDVTIAQEVTRKGPASIVAKTRAADAFTGKLIVLVNSGSASSAELLARVVQLEKRGVVIGDRTAGAVMETQFFPYAAAGSTTIVTYAFAVTRANLLMADGKSLEGAGVTPDEMSLPTAGDIATGADPVLAHAAATAGVTMTPAAAGLLFPFEWVPLK